MDENELILYKADQIRKGFEATITALILTEDIDGLNELAMVLKDFTEKKLREIKEREKWI